jgi:hypothetical protein
VLNLATVATASGAGTTTLRLTNIDINEVRATGLEVRLLATNSCRSAASAPALLELCPSDFNCDGGVDGGDVEAFFGLWQSGDTLADTNADGGIDGADIAPFFEKWAAGC